MAWTAKILSKEDVKTILRDGTFDSLYYGSKAALEAGTVNYPGEGNDNDKIAWWWAKFNSTATPSTVIGNDGTDYDYYTIGLYQDDYLLYITNGYYDSNDNSWSDVNGLCRGDLATGSKAYLYMLGMNNVKFSLLKELGANKIHFVALTSGALNAKLKAEANYGQTGLSILDYSSLQAEDITEVFNVTRPGGKSADLPDGTKQPDIPSEKIADNVTGDTVTKITVNFK